MSGNASRYSHQPNRRYSLLLPSQGAMVTDADQREAAEIQLTNTATLGDTAIRTGVPKTGGVLGWNLHDTPSAHRHITRLQPGRVVADGLVGLVELADPATSLTDPQGLDLLHRQRDLQGLSPLPATGTYLVYADLWQRPVGPAEDARLVDPAFLSAETATRSQLTTQLKVAQLATVPDDVTCRHLVEATLPAFGDFRLTDVRFENEEVALDICDPCATVLSDPQFDTGNHLFRLEVHDAPLNRPETSGALAVPRDPGALLVTLKWSHDNGSIEVPIAQADALLTDSAFDTAIFELTDPTQETRLGLWTEQLTQRGATLHSRAAIEAQLATAPATAFLRVWDGAVTINLMDPNLGAQAVGLLSASGTVALGADDWQLVLILGGLRMELGAPFAGPRPFLLPGDAWLVEIREYADGTDQRLTWQPKPAEAHHHYCWLGVIQDGQYLTTEMPDSRSRAFPALTEIEALDIAYDSTQSGAAAITVQGAIDLLFAEPDDDCQCQCTVMIIPEKDLWEQLSALQKLLKENPRFRALICFPAGSWYLEQPIDFEGSGALIFRGAGDGVTLIDMKLSDTTHGLSFTGFERVRFEELTLECGFSKNAAGTPASIIEAVSVGRVEADTVSAEVSKTPAGICQVISVSDPEAPAGDVALRDCRFRLGTGGIGIAVTGNAESVHVENCQFTALTGSVTGGGGGGGPVYSRPDMILASAVVRATATREAQVADHLYAPFPGQPTLLIDLTGLPPSARQAGADYWRNVIPMLEASATASRPEDFAQLQSAALALDQATEDLEAAQQIAPAASPLIATPRAPRSAGPARVIQPVALRRMATGIGIGKAAPDIVRIGEGLDPRMDAILTPAEAIKLKRTASAAKMLVRGKKLVDYLDLYNKLRPPPIVYSDMYFTIGIMCLTETPPDIWICDNRFDDLDIAIDLFARPVDQDLALPPPPQSAILRGNRIRRQFRNDVVMLKIRPGFEDAARTPRYPINLRGYRDILLDGNEIAQISGTADLQKMLKAVFPPNIDTSAACYAAIGLSGTIEPKILCRGNSAWLFTHAIYVDCAPIDRLGLDAPPLPQTLPNIWIFRDNTVKPHPLFYDLDTSAPVVRPAVLLSERASSAAGYRVRVLMHFNHPGNLQFEPEGV